MSSESDKPTPPAASPPEDGTGVIGTGPGARKVPAPIWLFVLFGVLIFWGTVYLDLRGGGFHAKVYEPYDGLADVRDHQPKRDESPMMTQGRQVYGLYCLPCHQAGGQGAPGVAPPLVGSEWVTTEGPDRLIRIVLNGLQGPITVKGQEWTNLAMLPWRDSLSDEDVAAVLTFIRQNPDWNHDAAEVTPEQVAEIRQATAARTTQWTAGELEEIPVQ